MIYNLFDTISFFFTHFLWPYTVLTIMPFALCMLVRYIAFKIKNKETAASFKGIFMKWVKVMLTIYFTPSIIILVFLFLFPKQSFNILHNVYWQLDDVSRQLDIQSWIINHSFYFILILSCFFSLMILTVLLTETKIKLTKKVLLVFFLISIPICCVFLYITSLDLDIIELIIFIGAPGALIANIKKG